MVQRGRNKYNSNTKGNIKGNVQKPKRLIRNNQESGSSPSWPEDDLFASTTIMDDTFSPRSYQTGQQYAADNLPIEDMEWQHTVPLGSHNEETALAPVNLNSFYEALSEMRERIIEAEQNLEHSRQVQQTLRQEMDTAAQMAQEAEEELTAAAKKAAYLKHEAEQIYTEGQTLQRQLSSEEQRWRQILDEEQRLLADTEQKLRIADEESQRIRHAKEVAARMNERELWRLGSSKQGLWLQRRKVQGNALAMTRDKSGSWHMPKVVSSPSATYVKSVLEQDQKIKQKLRDNNGQQRKKRLSMLAESAQALTKRQASQIEAEYIEQLAKEEAARHLAVQADLLDMRKSGYTRREPTPLTMPEQTAPNLAPTPAPAPPGGTDLLQILTRQMMPEQVAPNLTPTPVPVAPISMELPQTLIRQKAPEQVMPNPMPVSASPISADLPYTINYQKMPEQAIPNPIPATAPASPVSAELLQVLARQGMQERVKPNPLPTPALTPYVSAELLHTLTSMEIPQRVIPNPLPVPAPVLPVGVELLQVLNHQEMPPWAIPNPLSATVPAPSLSAELTQTLPRPVIPEQTAPTPTPDPPAHEPLAGLKTLLRQVMPTKQTAPDPISAPPAKAELPQSIIRQEMLEQTAPPSMPDPPAYEPLAGLRTLLRQVIPMKQTAPDPLPQPAPALPNAELLQVLAHQETPRQTAPTDEPKVTASMRNYVADMVQNVSQQTATTYSAPYTAPSAYAQFINAEVSQALRNQETAKLKAPRQEPMEQNSPYREQPSEYMPLRTAQVYASPVYVPSARMESEMGLPPQTATTTYAPPVYMPLTKTEAEKELSPQTMPAAYAPPVNIPPAQIEVKRDIPPQTTPAYTPASVYAPPEYEETKRDLPLQSAPEYSYAPAVNNALLQTLRPYETPGQVESSTDDPLQFLAMQAAMETAARRSGVGETEKHKLYAENPQQLAVAAEYLQTGQEPPEINEDDMQQLTRQANMLAKQHLARHQATGPANGSAAITQKVAEESGSQDHLLKEQQIAERAIAAAMAAARKAAQSAMSISEQQNKQVVQHSAEHLIASALSKASESGN